MILKANMLQVPRIQKLLELSARKGELIQRSLSELYDSVRDFQVSVSDVGEEILGCCALHPTWEELGEIRSLVVKEEARGRQIGRNLVDTCLEDARQLGIRQVFVLTFNPQFFQKLGFAPIAKAMLPHKIWGDCVRCIHFPDCKEQALSIDI